MQYTNKFNLKKPDSTDFYNIEDSNSNSDILDAALSEHGERLTEIEKSETLHHEQTGSIASLPTGALEGVVDNFESKGLSLVNSVENGDFGDGTIGWSVIGSSNSVTDNILSNTCSGAVSNGYPYNSTNLSNVVTGDKIFFYAKARITNSSCTRISGQFDDQVFGNVTNPNANEWYELYEIITYAGANRCSHSRQTLLC